MLDMCSGMRAFTLACMSLSTYTVTAFIQPATRQNHHAPINRLSSNRYIPTVKYMSKYEDEDDRVDHKIPIEGQKAKFIDALLEIPDSRLFAGDLLFILIINFLLQIGSEVGSPDFWTNGGFAQPVTMPTTLLAVIIRDSKMSISWALAALWNRSYSSASVVDDETAVKKAFAIWVDYCSLRILLELGGSVLVTHSSVDVLSLGIEVWYTAIVMAFFRLAYGRFR